MKRIGIIGSINRDTITHVDGKQTRSCGGILYTALALAHLGGGRLETWLLCRLGEDVAAEIMGLLDSCPFIRSDGVQVVSEANFHSRIRYYPDGSKDECLSGDIEPLSLEFLSGHMPDLDGLLVNFITGFELELETLIAVKQRLRGPLLMDVHSLTLGRAATGERFWKRPENWEAWVAQADVVQMNEAEAVLLGDLAESSRDLLRGFALRVLELGPRAVVLMRGAEGALGAFREGAAEQVCEQAAELPQQACDPTGCGDVFLAGLGAGVLSGKNLRESMDLAARAAGLNSRLCGVETLSRLAELKLD